MKIDINKLSIEKTPSELGGERWKIGITVFSTIELTSLDLEYEGIQEQKELELRESFKKTVNDGFPPQATAPDLEAVDLIGRFKIYIERFASIGSQTESILASDLLNDIDAYLGKHDKNNLNPHSTGCSDSKQATPLHNDNVVAGATDIENDTRRVYVPSNVSAGSNPAESALCVKPTIHNEPCVKENEESLTQPLSDEKPCSECINGLIPYGEGLEPGWKPCPECGGEGLHQWDWSAIAKCPTCRGTGKEPKE